MFERTTVRYVFFTLLLSVLGYAQQTGQGTLLDSAGATIPDAKVEAFDEARQVLARETTTGRDGLFYLRNLPPGTYTVTAEVSGFKKLERTGLKLDANQIMNLGTDLDAGWPDNRIHYRSGGSSAGGNFHLSEIVRHQFAPSN